MSFLANQGSVRDCGRITNPFRWMALSLAIVSAGTTGVAVADGDAKISVGIEGHYRVGCWTGLRLLDDSGGAGSSSVIETRDGDGVRVTYQQPAPITKQVWGYAVAGSEAAPLTVRGSDDVLTSSRFPTLGAPSRGPSMIPLKMAWIIALGDPLGVDQIGANELLSRDALIAVSKPSDAAGLPDSVLGYDGVDMIMINGSSLPILASMSEQQQSAISTWISSGGRLFVTLGESAPELLKIGSLAPGVVANVRRRSGDDSARPVGHRNLYVQPDAIGNLRRIATASQNRPDHDHRSNEPSREHTDGSRIRCWFGADHCHRRRSG